MVGIYTRVCVCVWGLGGGGGGVYTWGLIHRVGGGLIHGGGRGGIHGGNISAANQNDMILFYEDKYFLQLQN